MDFVVRHGLPGTPNRLTTNGGRRRGCAEDRSEGWVLLALWFDATRRRLWGGSPRTGWGRRRLGGLGAVACVVRHGPKTPGRLTTNGVGPTIGSEAWVLGAVWFDTTVRRLPVGSPRTGWGPTIGSEAWVPWPVWFDTTVRRLPGGSPRTGWGRRLARRLGCWGLCGSTRPSEDCRSAHHERGRASVARRVLECPTRCFSAWMSRATSWRWPTAREEISGRPSRVRQQGSTGCGAYDHGIRKSEHLVGKSGHIPAQG